MKGESLQMGEVENREVVQDVKGKMGKRFRETAQGRRREGSHCLTGNNLFAHSLLIVI